MNTVEMLEVREWKAGAPALAPAGGSVEKLRLAWHVAKPGSKREFRVAFRPLDEGGCLAYCVSLGGAMAEGETEAAALEALKGVLAEMLAQYREDGALVPRLDVEMEAADKVGATIVLDL